MRAQTGGFQTEYTLAGAADAAKPWVLLAHCLGGSLEIWNNQVEALSQAYRVLSYDLRGHGKTATSLVGYSVADLADDVVYLLDALAIERTSVVGLSSGGMVAQLLAARHPDRVEKLVLAHCTSHMDPDSRPSLNARAAAAEAAGLEPLADPTMFRTFSGDFVDSQPAEVASVRRIFCATDPAGFAGMCRAVADFDARPCLSQIEAPVLALTGDEDDVSPPSMSTEIAVAVRHGETATIPGAAHMSCIEQPARFNRVVLDFLGT